MSARFQYSDLIGELEESWPVKDHIKLNVRPNKSQTMQE